MLVCRDAWAVILSEAARLMCLNSNWVTVPLGAAVQNADPQWEGQRQGQCQGQACVEGVANDVEHRGPSSSASIRAKGLALDAADLHHFTHRCPWSPDPADRLPVT